MDYSIESGNQAYSLVALHSVAACIDSENPFAIADGKTQASENAIRTITQ